MGGGGRGVVGVGWWPRAPVQMFQIFCVDWGCQGLLGGSVAAADEGYFRSGEGWRAGGARLLCILIAYFSFNFSYQLLNCCEAGRFAAFLVRSCALLRSAGAV
jgi:hypothetical protein